MSYNYVIRNHIIRSQVTTNALIPIQIPSQYHHGDALYLCMYVVMLTVVEEEGVPLINMQLVVSIIPVDHKSYRIEAMYL